MGRRFFRQISRKRGQTMIFAMMVLVMIAIIALWNFDLNKILFVKGKARNGGDAAALAGARWQGITLNTVGQVNLMQAVALTEALSRDETDFSSVEAMGDLGARVSFAGPMTGVAAAQQFAKNNGIFNNEEFTADLITHAERIRNDYPHTFSEPLTALGGGSFWDEYANMYEALAEEGIAVEIENPKWFNGSVAGGHMLLNPAFYDAIAGSDWCWFLHNANDLLQNYRTWRDWPPLPFQEPPDPINAELLSCGIERIQTLDSIPRNSVEALLEEMNRQINERGLASNDDGNPFTEEEPYEVDPEIIPIDVTWYVYDRSRWGNWTDLVDEFFPWEGDVKSQYNYSGADAAVRIESGYDRMSPLGGADSVLWTSAAKPFGNLEGPEGPVRPDAYRVILPAFTDVRLIPIDASSAPAGGSHPGWAEFVFELLPIYMERGPGALPSSNWYAQQLKTWERPFFRSTGRQWILLNREDCFTPPPTAGGGGGGGGNPPPQGSGGTRRGH